MTSTDGITWTVHNHPGITRSWNSVCWSKKLNVFCAVASVESTASVATSTDGASWALQTAISNSWISVCWSEELGLFCAVANDGTSRIMVSSNGT
jgi:hypothetical protein